MSETYRALTRKYRPNSFQDIVSQEHVSNTLLNAIKQNRLSHAYMFCGPRGVGKTTMARVLARVINQVDDTVDGEALNQTMSITEMDAASNNKVEDVHHLREIVRIPPQNSLYKVIIVDEVHMLSKAAFNALLKTLEEPPKHVVFIFATTEPHKVLPTILSRVQRFDFKRIAVEEIVQRLRKISLDEHISIDEESLHVIAKKADGALRDALGLMDQAIAFCGDTIQYQDLLKALNVVGTDRLFEFMSCVKERNADSGLELINTLLQEGYDIQEFLIGLTEHLRNLYIAHHSPKLYLVEASEETKKKYLATSSDFSRDDLMRMLHMVSEAQIKLKDAHQPRIQFEITLLKLIHMEKSEQLAALLSDLEELKKKFNESELPTSKVDSSTVTEVESPIKEEAIELEPTAKVEVEVQETPDVQTPAPSILPGFDYDLGSPAIQTSVSEKAKTLQPLQSTPSPSVEKEQVVVQSTPSDVPTKKLHLEDVVAVWPQYLNTLIDRIPKILELQVQRAKPVKLVGHELYLAVDNPLAQKMLEEQEMELVGLLKEQLGVRLRFKVIIEAGSEDRKKAANPYERFKEIQQKDPIVRELVERFGAELEY